MHQWLRTSSESAVHHVVQAWCPPSSWVPLRWYTLCGDETTERTYHDDDGKLMCAICKSELLLILAEHIE